MLGVGTMMTSFVSERVTVPMAPLSWVLTRSSPTSSYLSTTMSVFSTLEAMSVSVCSGSSKTVVWDARLQGYDGQMAAASVRASDMAEKGMVQSVYI